MRSNFQLDQNELLETFLDKEFFTDEHNYLLNDRLGTPDFTCQKRGNDGGLAVELIVRPQCNQKCDYCYIYQHGKELYPEDERADNGTILRNLQKFLHYVIYEKHTFVDRWELFAGDLFYDDLFFDLIDIFYNEFKPLYDTYYHLFEQPVTILTPSNCSFVLSDDKLEKFEACVKKMALINCRIAISYSSDGFYATDTREHRPLDEAHFKRMQEFMNKYQYLAHPMVSYENVHNWIKNYDWWVKFYKGLNFLDHTQFQQPFMLEVRNDGWTPKNIEDFTALLTHMYKIRKDFYQENLVEVARNIFASKEVSQNDFLRIRFNGPKAMNTYSCALQNLLHVTLNNLSIVPCHRTSYPEFTMGYFDQDAEGNITGITAKNVNIGIVTRYAKTMNFPKCITCPIRNLCYSGCFGANYEACGDMFVTPKSVCDLMMSRYIHCLNMYENDGLIDIALENNFIAPEEATIYKYIASLKNQAPQPLFTENVKNEPRGGQPCFLKS